MTAQVIYHFTKRTKMNVEMERERECVCVEKKTYDEMIYFVHKQISKLQNPKTLTYPFLFYDFWTECHQMRCERYTHFFSVLFFLRILF